uniref:Uncharacterized protein n=1 Tax=Neolamprologus brichardi TaxID=32507 RepID=A0A3Q4GGR4_NEOBR
MIGLLKVFKFKYHKTAKAQNTQVTFYYKNKNLCYFWFVLHCIQLEQQTKLLHDRCVSISKENTELQILIGEEEEVAQVALAGFNAYRSKMEGHRAAVLHAVSQTKAHNELKEKKELVQMLRKQNEELKEDLNNPNGNTVQMAKVKASTTSLFPLPQIQNRRYEAIMKRLRCQLNMLQIALNARKEMIDVPLLNTKGY